MNPSLVIRDIRDKNYQNEEDFKLFLKGIRSGSIPEYQVSAFLMAVCLKGLSPRFLQLLTTTMRDSGTVFKWKPEEQRHLFVDKHSTGGVGDKVSLILAPLAAACGLKVPMVSGGGLDFTGGTLDKLDSIGISHTLPSGIFQDQVEGPLGVAMVGQSEDFVPLDRILYALRSVTATTDSLPLIVSSILSKKAAAGISGLVLDLKVGSGAFMKTKDEALELAHTMCTLAKDMDIKLCAVLTNMNQPLGEWVGNWDECYEAMQILQGIESDKFNDTLELTIELASEMMAMGLNMNLEDARALAVSKLKNGEALAKFQEIGKAQGYHPTQSLFPKNPTDVEFFTPERLHDRMGPGIPIISGESGFLSAIDTEKLARHCIKYGGGRESMTDSIDYNVGIQMLQKVGNKVDNGTILCRVYPTYDKKHPYDPKDLRLGGAEELRNVFTISKDKPSSATPLIITKIKNY